jgi:hypothetical protein
MPGEPFSLADLRTAADALYGRRQWQGELARDLGLPQQTIKRWFTGKPLPDIRQMLAATGRTLSDPLAALSCGEKSRGPRSARMPRGRSRSLEHFPI